MKMQFKAINKLNQVIHHLALKLLGVSEADFLELSEDDQVAHYEAVSSMIFNDPNVFSRENNSNMTSSQQRAWGVISHARTSATQSEDGVIKAFVDHALKQLAKESLANKTTHSNKNHGI